MNIMHSHRDGIGHVQAFTVLIIMKTLMYVGKISLKYTRGYMVLLDFGESWMSTRRQWQTVF